MLISACRLAVALVLAGTAAAGCAARTASERLEALKPCPECGHTFEALAARRLLHAGDQVRVVDQVGKEAKGTLLDISPTEFMMAVDGQRAAWAQSEVRGVWRRDRSTRTIARYGVLGALWGFGFGILPMFMGPQDGCPEIEETNPDAYCVTWESIVMFGGAGALTGAGIGAIRGRDIQVFEAGAGSAMVRFRPRAGRGGAAVEIAVAFRGW